MALSLIVLVWAGANVVGVGVETACVQGAFFSFRCGLLYSRINLGFHSCRLMG